jgi:C_GCAxxG_C_C family probable redox protein
MGRRQEVCGAVSGALLVLGALFGRGAADDREKTETTYRLAAELQQRFTAAHGTVSCRELIAGYDLSTAEGQAAFKADNKIADCHAFVASVCGMLAALLAEQGSSRG